MDAQLFQSICDALQSKKSCIKIPLRNACPITKIIWSSFDFMSGPTLKFVWEADYTNEDNCNASVDETVDGNNTQGSGTTMEKDQYEEIDEAFKDNLISAAINENNALFDFGLFNRNNEFSQLLESAMSDESCLDTNSTLTFLAASKEQINLRASQSSSTNLGHTVEHFSKLKLGNKGLPSTSKNNTFTLEENNATQDVNECTVMSDSCVDSGIVATISMESDLSINCSQNFSQNELERPSTSVDTFRADIEQVRYRVGSDDCAINLIVPDKSNNGLTSNNDIGYCEEATEDDPDEIQCIRENFSRMTQSPCYSTTTSAIGDKVSTCDFKTEFYNDAHLLTEFNSIGGNDCGVSFLSDEEFITKFILAEQICSPPLVSSPLLHKFTIVPARKVVVGSYVFSVNHKDEKNSTSTFAISIIVSLERSTWYMKRQSVFEEYFIDMVSSVKAAYLVESMEDVICRMTRDVGNLFDLFSTLEQWPLLKLSNSGFTKIQSSYLWEKEHLSNLGANFLAKAITACLITKGMCTVIGVNYTEVLKMMQTLSFFIDKSDYAFCLKPFHFPFSPYLRLQAIKRAELEDAYLSAINCHWPVAIIDMDRKSVTYSGTYAKHRTLKKRAQFFQVGQILKESGILLSSKDEQYCLKETQIEMQVIKADSSVIEFLENLFLLPLDRIARFAFIDHFHLILRNRADAFLQYVQDVSLPNPNDKRNAISAPWSLATAKRVLNLQSESTFAITLAKADSLRPMFAEFIYQTVYKMRN